jgi:glycosyltransferase involved in cell wall biosynthesis
MQKELASPPAISICMPCYNAGEFIKECIESILNQSFRDFELLIADDGSTDNSLLIINSFNDKRIKLFKREHDFIGNLNFLLDSSIGKYIARMDADDIMLPERLLTQFNYMELHPEVDVLGGGMEYIGAKKGLFIPQVSSENIRMEQMLTNNIISHPTVLIRRNSINEKKIRYENDYIYAEDYRIWIEMLKSGLKLDNLGTVLIKYRVSHKQNSVKYAKKQSEVVKRIQDDIRNHIAQTKKYEQITYYNNPISE